MAKKESAHEAIDQISRGRGFALPDQPSLAELDEEIPVVDRPRKKSKQGSTSMLDDPDVNMDEDEYEEWDEEDED